ncbi:MAG: extracellular solute-binding protein [Streptosporangiales bacterium]|nr:extracellular solute-binding protein [Streptosporangiales bacterium]
MRHVLRLTAAGAALALTATACGGGGGGGGSEGGGEQTGTALKGVKIEVAAKWTGPEQQNFEKVLDAFEKKTGATVTYASTGENTDAFLGPRLEGGNPPDVAILPQPGLMQQYAAKDQLKPLNAEVTSAIDANYTPYWKELGSVDGKPYGLLVKSAFKSIIWYRTDAFDEAGVQPPATFDDMATKTAPTLADAGITPFTLAAASADSWTLTDWFENVYLSQAGPEKYDQLAEHEIPWTDPSVTQAMETLVKIWGKPENFDGGKAGALKGKFDSSVTDVFAREKAAMVYGGDFAAANIGTTEAKVGEGAKTFPFPKAGDTTPAVLGGDVAVALKDNKGAMELMKFLATPEAGTIWAGLGGYLSPNKNLKAEAYPDAQTKQFAQQIQASGDAARYDMSDLTPAGFGATPGEGLWEGLRSLVQNPSDIKAVQDRLEADAKNAFKD